MSKEKNLEEISVSFQRIANSCKSQYGLVDDGTGWEVTNLTDALLRISEGLPVSYTHLTLPTNREV